MLDVYKELTPVVYGEHGIKNLYFEIEAGRMCFHMHWHDRMELLYVTKGELELHLNDRQVTVLAGQVAVIQPHMLHCGFAAESGVAFHTVMFDLENFCHDTAASHKYITPIIQGKTFFQNVVICKSVVESVKQLVETLIAGETNNALLSEGLIYTILGKLYQYCTEEIHMHFKISENFRNVLEYINEHFVEHISTESLSQRFGYNETYFCRKFKSVTGLTLMKYVQILRMELAQRLLKNTEKGISEIALECGFTDISYFSNCFRKQVGMAPKEFRRVHR